jgi:hypothetical protein
MSTLHRKSGSTEVVETKGSEIQSQEVDAFFRIPLLANPGMRIAMTSLRSMDTEQSCVDSQSASTETWPCGTAMIPGWPRFSSGQSNSVQLEEQSSYGADLLYCAFPTGNQHVPQAGSWIVRFSILALTILLVERRFGIVLAPASASCAVALASLAFLLGRYWRRHRANA